MIKILNGHSLTAKDKFMPEKMSMQLSERTSTATLTLNARTAPALSVGDWVQTEEGPGGGIVWRVKMIDTQVDKDTVTVTLEHAIAMLKDNILFGETKSEDISGGTRCTAMQAIQFILWHQQDWVLGELQYNVAQPYSFNGEDLLAAMETVSGTLEDCVWQYGFTTYPFKLYIRRAGDEVRTEMRTDRNIRTLRKTVDRSRMYTRHYPIGKDNLKLPGGYVSKNEHLYGTVCKTETDQSKETEEELRLWATGRLNRHCEPIVTVTISGMDLHEATGEDLDAFTIGKMCRVPLPEYNTTILERVTKLNYPDVYGEPTNVTVTLANELQDVASIIRQNQAAAAGGGRAAAKKAEEDHAWFVDTTDHVGMIAEAVAGEGADKDWSRVSSVIVDGQGIHQRVTYTEDELVKQEASIEVQQDFIDQTVRAVGADGKVTAASICLAINKSGSSATISADHIILSGTTKINDVMTVVGNAVGFSKPVICTNNVNINSGGALNAYNVNLQGSSPINLNALDMAKAVKDFKIEGGTLTLTRWNGQSENFNKATSITQTWSSGNQAVHASAGGYTSDYVVGFRFGSYSGGNYLELYHSDASTGAISLAGSSKTVKLGRSGNTVQIQDGNGNQYAGSPTYTIPASSWSYGNLQESSSSPGSAAKTYDIDTRYQYHYFDITVGGETKRIVIRS